ncbi:diguanylate cyclase domain-containing protein [Metabacillus fastidiosus]
MKKLNDTQGHKKGDEVLKQVARIVQETVSGKGIGGALWWRGDCTVN